MTNPYDPWQNLMAGAQYLQKLHTLFNYIMQLLLPAYNLGPKALSKKLMKILPFIETRFYVPEVLSLCGHLRAD